MTEGPGHAAEGAGPPSNKPGPLLVTGFGPFPGMPANPSQRLAHRLGRMRRPALADVPICVRILPTTWDAVAHVPALISDLAPSAILMLGVAGRRKAVCVESRAVNAAADAPDARRRHPMGRAVKPGAPAVLRATAEVQRLRARLRTVPAAVSRDAGRYLCNALYFEVLAALASGKTSVPAVFVHVPASPRPGGPAYERQLAAALGHVLVALAAQRRPAPREGAARP